MPFSPKKLLTRLPVALATIAVTSAAHAEEVFVETAVSPYFSIGLIAAGLVALIVMRRRNLPTE